jgi:L-fucose isomerase-like protein
MKPKIGILFLTSGWFREVGLQGPGAKLSDEVQRIGDEVLQNLSVFLEPVYGGILFTEEDAAGAARTIAAEAVDGLIIAPLMWCEDQILRAALKELSKLPTLLCTFFPNKNLNGFVNFQEMLKGSGSVGTLQASGFLKREGYSYRSVSGFYGDERVYDEIRNHCLAFGIMRQLRKTTCGVLPFRCEQMSTTYVDEFGLRARYGVELSYLEIASFRNMAQSYAPEQVESFKRDLEQKGYDVKVDDRNLTEGIKYALALGQAADEKGLQIVAMNDVIDEMHTQLGLRPCLYNPHMNESGVVVVMEADIAAGVAMHILRHFTDQSPFYTEIFTADLEENALLMGHAGCHDPANRDPEQPLQIIQDVEYENSDTFTGAAVYFKYRPGPVTVVNAVWTGGKLRWNVFEGESLAGPMKMGGNCHLFCRIAMPVTAFYKRLLEAGASQHFVVVSGHIMEKIEVLCQWLDIDFLGLWT